MASHHILLVSKELIPLYKGMKKFPADSFYLLCSEDTRTYADTLKKLWTSEGGDGILRDGYWDIPPFDAPAVADAVAGLIKTIPREDTVYINLTGGTKPMAWGVMKAVGLLAENPDKPVANTERPVIRAFYVTLGDVMVSFPDLSIAEPVEVRLKTTEFLSLSGTMSFAIGSNAPEEDLLTNTLKIISMFRSFPGIRNKLKEISDNKRAEGEMALKVRKKQQDIAVQVTWTREKIAFRFIEAEKLFELTGNQWRYLLLEGGWWEYAVFHAACKWEGAYSVHRNTKIKFDVMSRYDRNEIDIIVNVAGRKLIFLECKSGEFDTNNLNKLEVVRKEYGGLVAGAALVLARENNEMHLKEGAENLKLSIIEYPDYWRIGRGETMFQFEKFIADQLDLLSAKSRL